MNAFNGDRNSIDVRYDVVLLKLSAIVGGTPNDHIIDGQTIQHQPDLESLI